ncbi:unnamed protein product, partial [Prorocentrum cordatum]
GPPATPAGLRGRPAETAAALAVLGLGAAAAERKAGLFAEAARRLERLGLDGSAPCRAFWVPGCLEVSGRHTAAAGGRAVLCALERGLCAVVAPRADALLRVAVGPALCGPGVAE